MNIKESIRDFVLSMKEFDNCRNKLTEYKNKLSELDEKIDFSEVEEKLGYNLHQDLKDFYNSYYFKEIEGLVLPSQIKPTEKWGSWFEFEGQNKNISVSLNGIPNREMNLETFIDIKSKDWSGGNEFGRRLYIGSIYDDRDGIILVFNNDTGKIEWIDFEYGQYGNLEEDPNGVLANSLFELISLMKDNTKRL